ncbi:MAG: hypothetical protein ACI9OJ_002884 [Myxococcota bacterium]|jgi:hypothetical protein
MLAQVRAYQSADFATTASCLRCRFESGFQCACPAHSVRMSGTLSVRKVQFERLGSGGLVVRFTEFSTKALDVDGQRPGPPSGMLV